MNNQRLGCLSPLAILSALVALIVLIALEISSGNSMFSPGALHIAHADTGKNCGACHAPFWSRETLSERCLACHTKIQGELGDSTSLHGALFREHFLACQDCHTEHAGPEASLTDMDSVNFPHAVTGFALTAHQTRSPGISFTCQDCHTASTARFDQALCADCHRSLDAVFTTAHSLEFGTDCLACHDGVDRYGKFDHSRVTFKLTGKHNGAACSRCHLNARTVADLQNTPTACESCHRKDDAHAGKFGAQCGVCHTPEGWQPAKFDHNLAAFKLEGKHAGVECELCHTNGYTGTPQDCYSCHKQDDEHNGEFGQDCALCHTPSDWEQVNIDHNLFAFKLEGKHAQVECQECHRNRQFKGTPTDCYSCHQQDDEHRGRFGTQCEACHTPTDWGEATFDHSRSNFPLTGAHANVKCESCHKDGRFQGTSTACAACHGNPVFHAGLFLNQACSACHSTSAWLPGRYNGPHPGIADEGGSGVNHGGQGCRSCHTANLSTATCTACHDSNNPDGDGGGDD